MENTLLSPEVQNYGQNKYEEGYQAGYLRATHDARKRRILREASALRQFSDFYDYLDDVIASHKKK